MDEQIDNLLIDQNCIKNNVRGIETEIDRIDLQSNV